MRAMVYSLHAYKQGDGARERVYVTFSVCGFIVYIP